jgi:S1-C subfamily serine protease
MTKNIIFAAIAFHLLVTNCKPVTGELFMANLTPKDALPVSAPITTDSSGRHGAIAAKSVMRIICKTTSMGGTGFLHKSGMVITAAHVVEECKIPDLLLILSSGRRINIASVKLDITHDLALVSPVEKIEVPTLPISTESEIPVGTQVTTWGFPAGYNGLSPLLTVGYLAGTDRLPTSGGLSPVRWVVNAAFNSGNSGGPVLSLDDGSVIGVVSTKLAPIPLSIEGALDALSKQQSGFIYTKTLPTGEKVNVSEGQVVAEVLKYLRSQTQLVLGHAVTSQDIRQFLIKEKVEP